MADLSRGIFLSYRREDAAPYALLLQEELRRRIPDVPVFMDLDSIEGGLDFAEEIRKALDSCAMLVALIGRQWITLADAEGRRFDNPDWVRFEVQAALERGVRVIPVLVDGAEPIRQGQLPPELQQLARLNALELSYRRYQDDANRLLDLIQKVLEGAGRQAGASRTVKDETRRDPNHERRIDAAVRYITALDTFRRAVRDLDRNDSESVRRATTAARASADAGVLVQLYFSKSVQERSEAASQIVVSMHLSRLEGRDLGDSDIAAKTARDELINAMKRQLGWSEDDEDHGGP